MNDSCVYIWVNETTNEPFYVGCGSITRAKSGKKNRSKAFDNVLKNNKCHYVILKQNLSQIEAAQLERQVIKDYREQGIDLVNQTNGGEKRHYTDWTEEMRKEYSERLKGKNNPNYGHHWSEELKKKMSEKYISEGTHAGGRNGRAKPVMCVETGEIFACKEDASSFLGVATACSSIYFCLKNPKRVAGKGKYHFVGQDMFDTLNTEEKRIEWLEKIKAS